jgi:hypothetical protein
MRYILIFIAFFSLFFNSCNTSFIKNDLSHVLGIKKVEIVNSQKIDEWAGIHGDGVILEIYELSEKTVKTFEKESVKNLPDNKNGKGWQKYNWNTLPIDTSYHEVFIMCLNYYSNSGELQILLNEINKLIEENKNIYYSFYYRPNKENPQNVQLFILDIENRKLYAIDQQI